MLVVVTGINRYILGYYGIFSISYVHFTFGCLPYFLFERVVFKTVSQASIKELYFCTYTFAYFHCYSKDYTTFQVIERYIKPLLN